MIKVYRSESSFTSMDWTSLLLFTLPFRWQQHRLEGVADATSKLMAPADEGKHIHEAIMLSRARHRRYVIKLFYAASGSLAQCNKETCAGEVFLESVMLWLDCWEGRSRKIFVWCAAVCSTQVDRFIVTEVTRSDVFMVRLSILLQLLSAL